MNDFFKSVLARSCGTAVVLMLMESQAPAAPQVAAGGDVSTVAAAGDFLWAAGMGGYQADYSPPAALKQDHAWTAIDCADNGGLGIDGGGALWAWGSQPIISGATGSSSSFYPIRIGTDLWRSVSAQGEYSFGVKEDGTLWGWGNFNVGNVGVFFSNVPVQFGSATNWRFVTGSGYNLAIQDDGSLWAWGHNGHGNLGDGTNVSRSAPVRIGTDSDWKSAACGAWTSYGIKTDGSLWAWGSGAYGDGNAFGSSNVPVRVGTDNNWLKISGGSSSSAIAIRTDGSLWSWGQNSNGMLGLGTVTSQLVPARIGQENSWADLATGSSHVIAARNDGSIWAWGNNNIQQFGIAGISGSDVPLEVTAGFVPTPRFLIYNAGYPIAQNSYYQTLKTAILQEPTFFDIKVRNNGFAPLTLSAGQLPGITILPPGEIPGLTDATLQVRLDATGAGQFSGQVAVNSNDPDRPLLTLDLNGHVVSPANDTDGDGMNDAAEVALGALGFLWNSHQPALVTTFYENVGLAGFHGEREIMDVQWKSGTPLMEALGNTVWMPLDLKSSGGFSAPLLLPGNIHQTSDHALDVSVPLPAGKRFVRIR